MADDNFRPFRSRDPLPREDAERAASDSSDPLAELARLIGQSDPYNEPRRSAAYSPAQSDEEVESSGQHWAADGDYSEEHAEEERYDPPAAPSYAPAERSYENAPPPSGRYFSGAAAEFGGFREEAEAGHHDEHVPALRPRELPAYATAESDEDYAEEPQHEDGEAYAADHYYDEPPVPRRRGAVVVMMAVLGLAVIGTAGAFGYRAMFGGSMLPTLPPIIKASNGPNRIMPSYSDSQPGGNSGQSSTASPTENLVSREEQPVTIEPPKPPPRVVASIPVVGAQTAAPAANAAAGSAAAAPNAAPASPWPPPPPMPMTTSAPTPAPAPTQTSTEPKRIHTVTIRPDQAGAPPDGAAVTAPQPAPVARNTARPAPAPPKPTPPKVTPAASAPAPAGSNAPLSIVPGGQNEAGASAPRARAAPAPTAVASAAPVAANMPAPSPGGGYAVQVSSQRSEAEAQASFRELRAKFPNQLNGREPIIRRADLGAKGTYYRALVGPFASAEQAAEMCSGLKAAGGNCLVQKN
jgi:SPOR domain